MIAFNHFIDFEDEPQLTTPEHNLLLPTFSIILDNNKTDFSKKFTYISGKAELSRRNIRYFAEKPYENCGEGCSWGIEVKDVLLISWVSGESTVLYRPLKLYTPELLQFWILHTIIPMILALDERYQVMHIAGVEIDDKAILFSADSFGGKSTLTDYFIQKGEYFYGDDTLGISCDRYGCVVIPSYPYCRPYREAESLGVKSLRWQKNPKNISAIFVLVQTAKEGALVITKLSGIDKYRALHHAFFLNFDFLKQAHFQWSNQFLTQVEVLEITIPWEIERLEEVYESIKNYVVNELNSNYGKIEL